MCIISDGPLEVGCFILTSDHNSVHQAVAALTHEECVVKCHDDGMRIAAISNVLAKNSLDLLHFYLLYTLQGEDCYCYADIGTESTLMDQVASSQCNIACAGNPGQKCGGATVGTVLVAKCEQGWTRFGEKCLREVTFDNLDSEGLKFTDGIQTCAAVSPFFSISITHKLLFCVLVSRWIIVVSIITNRSPVCY